MYACTSQEPEFIQELIKYTKNINVYDNMKQTVCFINYIDIVMIYKSVYILLFIGFNVCNKSQ